MATPKKKRYTLYLKSLAPLTVPHILRGEDIAKMEGTVGGDNIVKGTAAVNGKDMADREDTVNR
jgi:hypothetical protein